MAQVIIKVDDDKTANAIALWFESEDALLAFNESSYADSLEAATGERLSNTDVQFDESSRSVTHVVELN